MTDGPRIGIVGVAGGWSSEALADAVAERTGFRLLVDMGRCTADLASGTVTYDGTDLCGLDGLIVKKIGLSYSQDMLDRLELLRFVHERGVPCFSKPESILRLLDRLSCTVTLAAAGIPMPPTTVTEDVDLATRAIETYGEAVLKPLYSTKARGMQLVVAAEGNVSERVRAFQEAGNPVMYIQKKIAVPGRDLGVLFLGGEHLGTYARVKNAASWNTTTRDGGHYEAHEATPDLVELAHRAQALFDLDMTSVDVVETEGGPMVFEVSAFGGFRGVRDALGVDAAALYAQYAIRRSRQ